MWKPFLCLTLLLLFPYSTTSATVSLCRDTIEDADINQDGILQKDEYVDFVDTVLGGCWEEVNAIDAIFTSFACEECSECCVGRDVELPLTNGNDNLTSFCTVVITAIALSCETQVPSEAPSFAPSAITESPSWTPSQWPSMTPSTGFPSESPTEEVLEEVPIDVMYLLELQSSVPSNETRRRRQLQNLNETTDLIPWLIEHFDELASSLWDGNVDLPTSTIANLTRQLDQCSFCWDVTSSVTLQSTTFREAQAFSDLVRSSIQNGTFTNLLNDTAEGTQPPQGLKVESVSLLMAPSEAPSRSPTLSPTKIEVSGRGFATPPPFSMTGNDSTISDTLMWVLIGVGGGIFLLGSMACYYVCWKRNQTGEQDKREDKAASNGGSSTTHAVTGAATVTVGDYTARRKTAEPTRPNLESSSPETQTYPRDPQQPPWVTQARVTPKMSNTKVHPSPASGTMAPQNYEKNHQAANQSSRRVWPVPQQQAPQQVQRFRPQQQQQPALVQQPHPQQTRGPVQHGFQPSPAGPQTALVAVQPQQPQQQLPSHWRGPQTQHPYAAQAPPQVPYTRHAPVQRPYHQSHMQYQGQPRINLQPRISPQPQRPLVAIPGQPQRSFSNPFDDPQLLAQAHIVPPYQGMSGSSQHSVSSLPNFRMGPTSSQRTVASLPSTNQGPSPPMPGILAPGSSHENSYQGSIANSSISGDPAPYYGDVYYGSDSDSLNDFSGHTPSQIPVSYGGVYYGSDAEEEAAATPATELLTSQPTDWQLRNRNDLLQPVTEGETMGKFPTQRY